MADSNTIRVITEELNGRAARIGQIVDAFIEKQSEMVKTLSNLGNNFSGTLPSVMLNYVTATNAKFQNAIKSIDQYKRFIETAAETYEWTDSQLAQWNNDFLSAKGVVPSPSPKVVEIGRLTRECNELKAEVDRISQQLAGLGDDGTNVTVSDLSRAQAAYTKKLAELEEAKRQAVGLDDNASADQSQTETLPTDNGDIGGTSTGEWNYNSPNISSYGSADGARAYGKLGKHGLDSVDCCYYARWRTAEVNGWDSYPTLDNCTYEGPDALKDGNRIVWFRYGANNAKTHAVYVENYDATTNTVYYSEANMGGQDGILKSASYDEFLNLHGMNFSSTEVLHV